MQHAQSRELRAAAVWAVAVAGHLLLVMAFLSANRGAARRLAAMSSEPLLVLIDIPPRPSTAQQLLTRDEGDARARRQVPQAASAAPAVQQRVTVHIRCLVGLPFFGCAFGHLPEPDSGLFTDMSAVDRSRSSVPEIPDCLPSPAQVELADPAAVAAPVSAAPR
jgi:phage tail protein X